MTTTMEAGALGARIELRVWYLDRLRPRLEYAVAAGTVEPGEVQALDLQLSRFFDHREAVEVPQEAACPRACTGSVRSHSASGCSSRQRAA